MGRYPVVATAALSAFSQMAIAFRRARAVRAPHDLSAVHAAGRRPGLEYYPLLPPPVLPYP